MKVTTDGCLFGAWVANEIANGQLSRKNCLDVGAGTGLLSLMIAQKSSISIDAVEIDEAAATQAKENVEASAWRNQVNVITQDILTWQTNEQYDCIVSNPPFYESDLKSRTKAKNFALHDEGLKLPQLFSFIKNHLAEEGVFFLLLPAKRTREIDALLKQEGLCAGQKVWIKQTPKHQPFRVIIQGGQKKVEQPIEASLTIKDAQDQYTPEFAALLKDYYLYL